MCTLVGGDTTTQATCALPALHAKTALTVSATAGNQTCQMRSDDLMPSHQRRVAPSFMPGLTSIHNDECCLHVQAAYIHMCM